VDWIKVEEMPDKPSDFEILLHTDHPTEVSYVLLDGQEERLALVS